MAIFSALPTSGAVACLASSIAAFSPRPSSSPSCCVSSFPSQSRRKEIGSENASGGSCGFRSLGEIARGHTRARSSGLGSRGRRIRAGTTDPGSSSSSESGSGEPGPSGNNGEDKNEDLDLDASFRLQTADWRAFRAKLVKGASGEPQKDEDVQRWAHSLVKPEQGCLLIAHPTAFGSRQTYFNQAVIFLFEHGDDGSAGFILNKPTSYSLGQVPGFETYKPDFADAPLSLGGVVGTNLIQVLHGVRGLQDSKEVISGVYLGGPEAVKDSVKRGETVPNDFRWFLGYCGWRPGQLEQEVDLGVWFLASASRDIATDQCIRLKGPLWREVLELMGGEYSLISKRAFGEI